MITPKATLLPSSGGTFARFLNIWPFSKRKTCGIPTMGLTIRLHEFAKGNVKTRRISGSRITSTVLYNKSRRLRFAK